MDTDNNGDGGDAAPPPCVDPRGDSTEKPKTPIALGPDYTEVADHVVKTERSETPAPSSQNGVDNPTLVSTSRLADTDPTATVKVENAVAPQSETIPSPTRKRKRPSDGLCDVCGAEPGKYKCPRCTIVFCSMPCSKKHKENHPPDAPPQPKPTSQNTQPSNGATNGATNDPFSVLLDFTATAAFEKLFEKYPSLPDELRSIECRTRPPGNHPASKFPTLGVNSGRGKHWTNEKGLRRGMDALRKARTDPGDTGDGLREYGRLVMGLLAESKKKDAATAKVHEEVVAEEKGEIARLLKEEGRLDKE